MSVQPAQADAYVQWSSSNESVATVSQGMVKGISKGTAVITANVGGASATAVVTVVDSTVDADVTIKVGQKLKIKFQGKVKRVSVSDKSILKIIKGKGKTLTVKGKNRGIVVVQGYNKKGKQIGWIIVKVE